VCVGFPDLTCWRPCQDVVLFECTPRVKQYLHLLKKHLPMYSFHFVPRGQLKHVENCTISPHQIGWPLHRPRFMLILTLDASCYLPHGLDNLVDLFQHCTLDVSSLLVAGRDEVEVCASQSGKLQVVIHCKVSVAMHMLCYFA
jgi:hypothetical protein